MHRGHRRGGGGVGFAYAFIGFIVGCATENTAAEIAFGLAVAMCFLLVIRSIVRMLL